MALLKSLGLKPRQAHVDARCEVTPEAVQ
jgi:hypothetical protein